MNNNGYGNQTFGSIDYNNPNQNNQRYNNQNYNNQGYNQNYNNQGYNQNYGNQGYSNQGYNNQNYNQGYNKGYNNQNYNQQKSKEYYNYNFVRKDAKGCFVEICDNSFNINKMLFRFVKYGNGYGDTSQQYTIDCYLDLDETLGLLSSLETGRLDSLLVTKGAYAVYSGYNPEKAISLSRKGKLPFDVPEGKAVSKIFSIMKSKKEGYDYLIKGSYKLAKLESRGTGGNGIIVPEGDELVYLQIPLSYNDLAGMLRFAQIKLQAYQTVRTYLNAERYKFSN